MLQKTKVVWKCQNRTILPILNDSKDPWKIQIVLGKWDHRIVESQDSDRDFDNHEYKSST